MWLSWSACQSAVPPFQNESVAAVALGLAHRGRLVDGFVGSGQALPLAEPAQLQKFRVHSTYQGLCWLVALVFRVTLAPCSRVVMASPPKREAGRLRSRPFLPLALLGIQGDDRKRHDFRYGPFDLDGSLRCVDLAFERAIRHFAFNENE